MSKRNYTHIQVLLPEIKAMQAEGKTQREIAEYYGFKDKQVVKELLKRERRKERKLEAGILPRPQGRPRKSNAPRDIVTEQHMRSGVCDLVLDTIHLAIRREKKKVAAELQLHSDQGAQYASQAYFELTQQYGITPSMSRCGNPYGQRNGGKFLLYPQNRMHLPPQTGYLL